MRRHGVRAATQHPLHVPQRACNGADLDGSPMTARSQTYVERLSAELDEIAESYAEVLARSQIRYVNPNHPGSLVSFPMAPDWGWAPSDGALEEARMALLARAQAGATADVAVSSSDTESRCAAK